MARLSMRSMLRNKGIYKSNFIGDICIVARELIITLTMILYRVLKSIRQAYIIASVYKISRWIITKFLMH